jgi:hypothetical protein
VSGTWENESATNWEGIGSSSPDRTVSASISSPACSVGVAIGGGGWARERTESRGRE